MQKFILLLPIIALCAAPGAEKGAPAKERVPVLLELFTSEGCSSCPPADRLLEALDAKQPVAGADLIVLSEHVDYWNSLGWKDPWSSRRWSARQEDYVRKLRSGDVYTPQLVVDGRFQVVGSDRADVTSAIEKAIREPKIPVAISAVVRHGDRVSAQVDAGALPRKAALYIALAENRTESSVSRGENSGHRLAHVAVVRVLQQEGSPTGNVNVTIPPSAGAAGLRLVVFAQDGDSGRVIGAASVRVPGAS